MSLKIKLIILNYLEFAVWGAYLISLGIYLNKMGMGEDIRHFYSMQGFVSIFMPALMGMVADRWMQGQRVLSLCHTLAGLFMLAACSYAIGAGEAVEFWPLFTLYSISVAFFMPTIALGYSVAYAALEGDGQDSVKAFPPIRVWGTVGFICCMWAINLLGLHDTAWQLGVSGALSLIMAAYSLTMPAMKVANDDSRKKSIVEALGLKAFKLFLNPRMALFFLFSMLLGVCLQITNGYATPYLTTFQGIAEYADTFAVKYPVILTSLSQISETLCILLIPYFLSKFGIKRVILIALLAWTLRFLFFGLGNPSGGVWLFVLSMIVYGVAFDFFNISGSLFVNQETDENIRSSAQGLFMMMTNGLGAAIGMQAAGAIQSYYVPSFEQGETVTQQMAHDAIAGWQQCWYIFAAYAFVVAILFAIFFKDSKKPVEG